MKKAKVLFVCGTDTNVGKTIITGTIALALKQAGYRVGVYKPLESGCSNTKSQKKLIRADSEFLAKCAGITNLDDVNTYAFKEPLAPGVAAQLNGCSISFAKIKTHLEKLKKKYDIVLIEGAGGLLVPVSGKKTNLDLIKHLKTPVLIVARAGLGTLNHTLLTYQSLKQAKIPVSGVILNQTSSSKDISQKYNAQILKDYRLPLWGTMPHCTSLLPKSLLLGIKGIQSQMIRLVA